MPSAGHYMVAWRTDGASGIKRGMTLETAHVTAADYAGLRSWAAVIDGRTYKFVPDGEYGTRFEVSIALRAGVLMDWGEAAGSRVCRCGRNKHLGAGFCGHCWRKLPPAVQRTVYGASGGLDPDGYRGAVRVLDRRKEGDEDKHEGALCVAQAGP